MITDHLIDLDNYELITNIGYSGQYYMIKENLLENYIVQKLFWH